MHSIVTPGHGDSLNVIQSGLSLSTELQSEAFILKRLLRLVALCFVWLDSRLQVVCCDQFILLIFCGFDAVV